MTSEEFAARQTQHRANWAALSKAEWQLRRLKERLHAGHPDVARAHATVEWCRRVLGLPVQPPVDSVSTERLHCLPLTCDLE